MRLFGLLDLFFHRNQLTASNTLTPDGATQSTLPARAPASFDPGFGGDAIMASIVRSGDADPDRLVGTATADRLFGGGGNDTLIGAGGFDQLFGGGANDRLFGGGGGDRLIGGFGFDRLTGANGNDSLFGGAQNDIAVGGAGNDLARGGNGNDVLTGGFGVDRILGDNGNDRLLGGGQADFIFGGAGRDRLSGGAGSDRLVGGGGNDTIFANAGNDRLEGGAGADVLVGGGQNNTLIGGLGSDVLRGGFGADIFKFSSNEFGAATVDRITDFNRNVDRIDVRGLNGVFNIDDLTFGSLNGNVTIEVDGGGRIVLQNVRNASLLDEGNFIFPTDGDNGDNTIAGGAGNDTIRGFGGDDVIGTSAGRDVLIGGPGADRYVIRLENGRFDSQVDVVQGFSYFSGDIISLNEVLSGVSFDDINEVFRATPNGAGGANTMIQVNIGGGFQDALLLQNVRITTEFLLNQAVAAPLPGNTAFVENPYGFSNDSYLTADPAATDDGRYVTFVSRENLDDDPNDLPPDSTTGNTLTSSQEREATQDVFRLNTGTGVLERVTERTADNRFDHASAPALSADGRFVAYVMENNNTQRGDVFVRNMAFPDNDPILISVDSNGNAASGTPINNVLRGGLSGTISNESVSVLDISGDGKRIAFASFSDLTGAGQTDANGDLDIYLRDLNTGRTTLISEINNVASTAARPYQGNDQSPGASTGDIVKISEDGRYIAFSSRVAYTPNEVDNGQFSTQAQDIYLHDTVTGRNILISSNAPGGATSFDMSADGSRIVFATNEAIAFDDTNDLSDVYVANINLGAFRVTSRERVSEAEDRFQLFGGDSYAPNISSDGTRIAFLSTASDLLDFDPDNDFGRDGTGDSDEFLFILDLNTRELTTPNVEAAVGSRANQITQAVLIDDGIVFRTEVDAAPGGSRAVTDSIAVSTTNLPVIRPDVPGAISSNGASDAELFRFSTIRSRIDSPSDVDVFSLERGSATREVSISVEGVDTKGGTLADPLVRIFQSSPTGTLVAVNDDGGAGRDAFLTFSASQGQNFFVQVTSADGGTGSYRIRVAEDDFAPSAGVGAAAEEFLFDI